MTNNITTQDWESLSAYLDGQLEPKEQNRLEIRLRDSNALRIGLEELRRTRDVLRSQPRIRAPRNFTLTPEMVGIKPRARRPGLFPVFSLASALASVLFIVVLVGEFLIPSPAFQVAQAPYPQAEILAAESAPPEAQFEEGYQPKSGEPSERIAPTNAAADAFILEEPAVEEAESALPEARGTLEIGAADAVSAYPVPEMPLEPAQGAEEPMAMMAPGTEEALAPESTQLAYLPQIEAESNSEEADEPVRDGFGSGWWSPWRIAQVSLGLIAMITGAIAVFLRRRDRT